MTMPAVTDMHFFAVVAQRSTLSEAALDLGLTASAVSRRLARLENRLGVRLVVRLGSCVCPPWSSSVPRSYNPSSEVQ